MTSLARANTLALAFPALLMAGALGSQYLPGFFGGVGLHPCEMCQWQRWPHYAAIAIALVAFAVKPPMRAVLVALAGLAVITSGAIGVFHAGVEYHWWAGPACSASGGGVSLEQIMRAPLVRCDVPQWTLAGISLAGFNALFSFAGGIAILAAARNAR